MSSVEESANFVMAVSVFFLGTWPPNQVRVLTELSDNLFNFVLSPT